MSKLPCVSVPAAAAFVPSGESETAIHWEGEVNVSRALPERSTQETCRTSARPVSRKINVEGEAAAFKKKFRDIFPTGSAIRTASPVIANFDRSKRCAISARSRRNRRYPDVSSIFTNKAADSVAMTRWESGVSGLSSIEPTYSPLPSTPAAR